MPTENPPQTTGADAKGKTHIESHDVPVKKQIEEYAQIKEERYNQIATHQRNTHTFAELASKVGEWQESIDGKKS